MTLLEDDTRHYTYADYLTWPDSRSGELIDGTAYVREPPAPTGGHQEMAGEIYYQAKTVLRGKFCRVFIAPFDVCLPRFAEEDGQIDTVVQPDVFIACGRYKLSDRRLRGAPDWLVEVLSPSTAKYDQNIKLPVYERAGVREVWLVHPVERTVATYCLEQGRYGRPTIQGLKGRTQLTAVPAVTIDWDEVLVQMGNLDW